MNKLHYINEIRDLEKYLEQNLLKDKVDEILKELVLFLKSNIIESISALKRKQYTIPAKHHQIIVMFSVSDRKRIFEEYGFEYHYYQCQPQHNVTHYLFWK